MSSPFQVVSPTMASTKNPFEKLSQSGVFASPSSRGSASLPEEYSGLNIKENDESEDEIMDPNKTLQMFSFSQPSQPKADPEPEESDDEDEEVNEEEEQPIQEQLLDEKKPSPFDSQKRMRRPHLQEALEMSLNRKSVVTKELEVPTILADASKTSSTKYTKCSVPPLDWTLKTGMSVTSPDDLSWCDQRSSSEDIAALQWFNSEQHQKTQTSTTDPESARRRLLAAAYHWTYPTNAPSIPQVQSINRLLKSATNMTASEKAKIGFVQLPDITGVKAVQSFSSKHDLEGSEDDEPSEIAPFLHAALKRAQISKCRVVSRPVEGSERVQKEYRVEIQGTLLPLAVKVLWAVFTDRLATGCSFNATSDVRSHGLNLRPLLHESSSSDESEVFVSPKALDQLRFDKDSDEYAWPTVDKGVV
ncbi:hypothetical protein BGZ74_004952 [Mortierella antarctica]|nr:hypothetical protein BGZ74_004952 [Mortierella antarctica]